MKIFFFNCFFLLTNLLFAQMEMVKKEELPFLKVVGANYRFVHLSEKGLLLMLESQENLRNSKREIVFSKYDTALNKIWTGAISINYSATMQQYCLDGDDLYYLINRKEYEYDILKIDLKTGLMAVVAYEKIMDLKVTHFEVAKSVLFFGGMVNSMPVVLQYDHLNSRVQKVLPSIYQEKVVLNALVVDQEKESLCVFMTQKNEISPDLYFNVYDLIVKLFNRWTKKHSEEYALLNFKIYSPNANEQYLFGTYGLGNRNRAQGFYVSRFFDKEESFIYFYDFSYLNNFFNHLGKKSKGKLFEKVKKRQQKGKTFIHDDQLFLHDLVIKNNQIYLTAESYATTYRANTYDPIRENLYGVSRNFNAAYRWYQTPFDIRDNRRANILYSYKNAVVCSFDRMGKLLWDNSFEYDKLTLDQLNPLLQVGFDQDSITMLHWQEKKLYLKASKASFEIDTLQSLEPNLLISPDERIEDSEQENINFWYGKYFLMHGIQEIISADRKKIRKVFYLAKMQKGNSKKEEKP